MDGRTWLVRYSDGTEERLGQQHLRLTYESARTGLKGRNAKWADIYEYYSDGREKFDYRLYNNKGGKYGTD